LAEGRGRVSWARYGVAPDRDRSAIARIGVPPRTRSQRRRRSTRVFEVSHQCALYHAEPVVVEVFGTEPFYIDRSIAGSDHHREHHAEPGFGQGDPGFHPRAIAVNMKRPPGPNARPMTFPLDPRLLHDGPVRHRTPTPKEHHR
jgi:hypothetical protein